MQEKGYNPQTVPTGSCRGPRRLGRREPLCLDSMWSPNANLSLARLRVQTEAVCSQILVAGVAGAGAAIAVAAVAAVAATSASQYFSQFPAYV
mmetsp:Transcript_19475/g.38297  ORF Transcript_19475/g.38297 Transcript_19475/m.38297 type:complete len:93 (-) Transcript_19475:162-440(-)